MLGEIKSTNSNSERSPFRFLNAIMETGEDLSLTDPTFDAEYNMYMINSMLSRHLDTISYAHQMNMAMLRKVMTPRQHFFCLLKLVPKKRRYSGKLPKSSVDDSVVSAVASFTKQSEERAREYMQFLSESQLKWICKQAEMMEKNGG